jgi:hypothetical protein
MEMTCSSETVVKFERVTLRYIPRTEELFLIAVVTTSNRATFMWKQLNSNCELAKMVQGNRA